MTNTTFYITIRIVVEHPDNISNKDIMQKVSNECDYAISYKEDDIEIVETLMVDVTAAK